MPKYNIPVEDLTWEVAIGVMLDRLEYGRMEEARMMLDLAREIRSKKLLDLLETQHEFDDVRRDIQSLLANE